MAKSEAKTVGIVDTEEALTAKIAEVRAAQAIFATYTQEQVDKIFKAAAIAANKARIPLAKMAVEETGMGIVEDKVIKNNYAAEHIYNKYKNCYIFVIYDKNDDVLTKVATVAAEVASDKLYVLDDETGSAEKINTEDVKTQSTESWADQVTESFAEYYQSKEVNDHLAAVVETAAVKTVR